MISTEEQQATEVSVDVLLIGGGIAGLWTLAGLQKQGYRAVLLESSALGAGQTRYAQGIIHGGTKYALTGKLTASSEAVADMPARWRACYEGDGELDLTRAELISDSHYLWSTTSLASRISGFFASKVMRSRSTELDKKSLPGIFQHADFKGQFYRLDEPVFDTLSVIRALAEPRKKSIMMIDEDSVRVHEHRLQVQETGGDKFSFRYKKVILNAGQGNEKLLTQFGYEKPVMQLRPLKMVVMRGKGESRLNDMIYAHCLGASVNPRITITSHRDGAGNIIWYMGGQLAEEGVKKSTDELITAARHELKALIPWLDITNMEFGVLEIDRAEINLSGKKGTVSGRPDTFFFKEKDDVITAWPTKLALAPVLADELTERIAAAGIVADVDGDLPEWKPPIYADYPWNDEAVWQQG